MSLKKYTSCFRCKSKKNLQLCGDCKSVAYCSKKCQKEDWLFKNHDEICLKNQIENFVKHKSDDNDDIQTNAMTVFSIRGIPGSGKTFMCKRLGIVCYDTDDIWTEVWQTLLDDPASAYKQLARRNAKEAETMFKKTLEQRVRVLIQKARDRGIDIAFAGILIDDIPADEVFFIEMSLEDLEVAYRRVILREIQKVLDHAEAAKRIVKQQDIDFVSKDLASRFHFEAINITTSFEQYQDIYKEALDYELGLKTRVLTQEKIIEQISSRISTN